MNSEDHQSFVQVKKLFSQIVNKSGDEQNNILKQLHEDQVLTSENLVLLKRMLRADRNPALDTDLDIISDEVVIEVAQDNNKTLDHYKQIGPYKILKPLGEGGMGHVYLAQRNDGNYDQKVALKLPHFSFSDAIKTRFENERQILAQLSHENIARLFDGGTTDDQQPYLIMEYIQGQAIDDYCTNQIPTLNQRIGLIRQTCAALAFSHQQFILHRDIKPSNILVTESGQVKLLDFGIAKLTDLNEESHANKTATQIMTRNYASPEQIQGQAVSMHSDLFSLAIIAYELITGYHPFGHVDLHQREHNLVSGKIIRVTQRTDKSESLFPELAKIPNGKIQGDLENILLKALSVEPKQRYSSVKEFSDDLLNFIEKKPVLARKPSALYASSKWIQRHKAITTLVFITALTLVFSTIYSLNKANFAIEQRRIAQVESEISLQVSNFLKDLFKKAKPMSASKGLTAQDLLFQGLENIEKNEFQYPETKYELLIIIHKSLISMGKLKESGDLSETHLANCREQLSPSHKLCVSLLMTRAEFEHLQHNSEHAFKLKKEAESLALSRIPQDKKELQDIWARLNVELINQGKHDESRENIYKIIEIEKQSPNPDDKIIIQTTHNLALNYIFIKDYDSAFALIEEIPQYLKKLPDSDQGLWLGSHYGLRAYYYSKIKKSTESYKYRKMRVELMESSYEMLPERHGRYLRSAAGIGARAGFFDEASDFYSRSYDFYVYNVTQSDYYKYEVLTYHILMLMLIDQKNEANNLNRIIDTAMIADPNLDGYEKLTPFHIMRLFMSIDKQPLKDTIKDYSDLYEKIAPKFKKYRSYKLYLAVIDIELKIRNEHYTEASNTLEEMFNIMEDFPDDYAPFKSAFNRLKKMIESTGIKKG